MTLKSMMTLKNTMTANKVLRNIAFKAGHVLLPSVVFVASVTQHWFASRAIRVCVNRICFICMKRIFL